MSQKDTARRQQIIDNAWLQLDENVQQIALHNWLNKVTGFAKEHPHLYYLLNLNNPAFLSIAAREFLGIHLIPLQSAIQYELWTHIFPMVIATRGGSKTFSLGLYAVLRALLVPESRIIFTGSGFRQAKLLFEVTEDIWHKSAILRDIGSGGKIVGPRREADRHTLHINNSTITAIPLGNGDKIRGLRANLIIADEFASINPNIYETVVAGFAAVSQNPIDNVKFYARRKALKERGLWSLEEEVLFQGRRSNQSILSGTCDYDFKHFARYWKRYHGIISSRGDKAKLAELTKDGVEADDAFDPDDYTIIRIPYDMFPPGFMDDKHVARQRMTANTHVFLMEYGAVFCKDSDGFFKRSLIETCVGTPDNPIIRPSGPISFNPRITGDPQLQYVMAVDPAYQSDNFCISIIELKDDHRRLVYCWTTNKENYRKKIQSGLVVNTEFYAYCARKIRNLMGVFSIVRIGIDSQGGGYALAEALQDPSRLEKGEQRILPVIIEDDEKPTDHEAGLHILELVNFASAEWTAQANHGMKMDLQDKILLFPYFDNISLGMAALEEEQEVDVDNRRLYDNLQDCILEIEDTKNELATIVVTETTTTGRERWDTPDNTVSGKKVEKLRKDRYSALLIANMLSRIIQQNPVATPSMFIGGAISEIRQHANKAKKTGQLYNNPPAWYKPSPNAFFGINRR
jgi:hypothetical protein